MRMFGLKAHSDAQSKSFYSTFQLYAKKNGKEYGTMESRDLILQADSIARSRGLNQSQWSSIAGYASNGQTVSRIMSRGECKLSTLVNLLDSIGCELRIINKDDA